MTAQSVLGRQHSNPKMSRSRALALHYAVIPDHQTTQVGQREPLPAQPFQGEERG